LIKKGFLYERIYTCKGHNLTFLPEVARSETGHSEYTTGLSLTADAAIDLQLHTSYSDGAWKPEALLDTWRRPDVCPSWWP